MRRLLQVFLQFGGIATFLILEGICLILIVQYNEEQRLVWDDTVGRLTNRLQDYTDNLTDLQLLEREVADLKKQNAYLRGRMDVALYENIYDLDTLVVDSSRRIAQFEAVAADIASKDLIGENMNLLVDKGKDHGIEARMGVVGKYGIIGVTTQSSRHFSRIMTFQHLRSHLSVALARTNFFGTLEWDGIDRQVLSLSYIPQYAQVSLGDTVLTSGYSYMFPAGLPVGEVIKFEVPSGSDYYNIKVKPYEDLANTDHVYIIRNMMIQELDSLEAIK